MAFESQQIGIVIRRHKHKHTLLVGSDVLSPLLTTAGSRVSRVAAVDVDGASSMVISDWGLSILGLVLVSAWLVDSTGTRPGDSRRWIPGYEYEERLLSESVSNRIRSDATWESEVEAEAEATGSECKCVCGLSASGVNLRDCWYCGRYLDA